MFAASKSAGGGRLITQTFTSNTTWIAPATTSALISMSGYGSAANPDVPYYGTVTFASTGTQPYTGFPEAPYAQWSYLYSTMLNAQSIIASGSGVRLVTLPTLIVTVGPDDRWANNLTSSTEWIDGTASTLISQGPAATSGNITYATGNASWYINANTFALGNSGTAATAAGKTFPGGTLSGSEPYRTAVAPVTTTYTAVPVTPGASYPIVVPSGGSVTIQYYG